MASVFAPLLALFVGLQGSSDPIVTLECGAVLAGTTLQTNFGKPVAAFRGIPYSLPPIGARRWLPPSPLACPAAPGTTLNVSGHGGACWQNNLKTGGRLNVTQSEDCLTLDVFAQPHVLKLASGGVPVIAWIYGGSLVHGSTNSYAGLAGLAARGEVVLVAMNYRLAAFGWLSLPELDAQDPRGVSSNRGLLDVQAALGWVQRHAASFGGDPRRVTLLGQSSGGTAILGLLASRQSRGLFSAAISLSASPNITVDLRSAQALFRPPVLAACGLPAGAAGAAVSSCLGRMSARQVAALFPESFNVEPQLPRSAAAGQRYVGLPVVDGVTVEVPVLEALRRGLVDVPLSLQTMLAEMDTYVRSLLATDNLLGRSAFSFFFYLLTHSLLSSSTCFPHFLLYVLQQQRTTTRYEGNATIYGLDGAAYASLLAASLREGGWSAPAEAAASLRALYAAQQRNSTELAYQTFLADFSFLCGHVALAEAAAASFRSPVYLSLGVQGPSSPMHVLPGRPPCRQPGHNFDYIAVARAWDFWYEHFPPTEKFHAAASDAALGDSLWQQWYALAVNGTAPQAAVFRTPRSKNGSSSSSSGAPDAYTINLQSTSVAHALDYARGRCATLEAPPLGLGMDFWLVN